MKILFCIILCFSFVGISLSSFHLPCFVLVIPYLNLLLSLNQPHEEVDAQEPMDSRAGSTLYRGCICGPIAESLNISMFQLILSRWCFSLETLKETNDCKFLYVAGSLIKTMVITFLTVWVFPLILV